jgi:hypothetical protein
MIWLIVLAAVKVALAGFCVVQPEVCVALLGPAATIPAAPPVDAEEGRVQLVMPG